jgi:Flp pilus assembly protein TadB
VEPNSRFGPFLYVISVLVGVAIIAVLWLVIKPGVVVGLLFTAFAVAILIWNGRLAFGRRRGSANGS